MTNPRVPNPWWIGPYPVSHYMEPVRTVILSHLPSCSEEATEIHYVATKAIHQAMTDQNQASLEMVRAIRACAEINKSEPYSHTNADGAQALCNLFSLIN